MRTSGGAGSTSEHGFSYELAREGDAAVLRLCGELDMASTWELAECLEQLSAQWPAAVVFDLENLEFCDSSGIDVFVRFHHEARKRGSALVLRDPTAAVSRVLRLTRLDQLVEVRWSGPRETTE
jgi:anti-anti-sigma factor